MRNRVWLLATVAAVIAGPAASQAPDAQAVLRAAAANMGVTNMRSIQYTGTGWIGAVGQNSTPANDWPRFDITSYTRIIDFDTNSSREEMTLVQGSNPQQGGGGTPIVGQQRRMQYVSGNYAWNIQGNNAVPAPQAAEQRLLEIYLTPWGFLKGAMANNATAVTRNEYGGRVTVVSFTALGKYRVNGTINANNEVQRVQTWIPNPVAGDLYYENVYSNYRTINGVKIPRFHQHLDYDDGGFPNPSGGDHGFGLETVSDLQVNVQGAALPVPDQVRTAAVPAVRVESRALAPDGVWLIGGGSHNSVLVEFRDYVAVIEAPLNEERSIAVIDEVRRLVPNKPIRYLINTHHHWDHLGGIRTLAHEGATIITHEGNVPFYREVLNPSRRFSLRPDRYYLNPPEEWSEGYIFEAVNQKYILGDDTRTVELHLVPGLAHAAGMLIAYLPKERIVVNADLYSPPAAGATPNPPNASARTFFNTLRRLNLNVETHVPIHGNPGPAAQFVQIMTAAQ